MQSFRLISVKYIKGAFYLCPKRNVRSMMKNFVFALLLLPFTASAQEIYNSFVVDGKKWNVMITDSGHMHDTEGSYFLKGDTVIGGHHCLKMYSIAPFNYEPVEYIFALYQEGDKVYGIRKGQTEPALWYDFGAKSGDVVYIGNEKYGTVQKVDTIWFDQLGFKRFFVKFNEGDICWLSGIGNVHDPTKILPAQGKINEVLSCEVDDKVILNDVIYYGSQYESLANSNFLWTMRYELVVAPEYGRVVDYGEIMVKDDAIIDGIPSKRMYYRDWREGELKPENWKESVASALHQDGGKVYHTGLGLIMDFSAKVGDVVKINELDADGTMAISYKVEAISDTVFASSTDKKRRRCLHVRNVHYQLGTDIWVEGIGSLTYGVGGDRTYYGGAWPQLMECRRGDEILYRHEDFVTSVNSVRASVNPASGIFDLQGRRLTQKPTKGVYIQDGKKVVVR